MNWSQEEHLEACMKISINGPPLAKFPCDDVVVKNTGLCFYSWCSNHSDRHPVIYNKITEINHSWIHLADSHVNVESSLADDKEEGTMT